jgi:hypothetical protein
MLDQLPGLVNSNELLVRRGHYFSDAFLIGVGETDWLVEVTSGSISAITPGPHVMRCWSFSIRATAEVWCQFWQPHPLPGYHDIFAMTKSGTAVLEGDLLPLMTNLRYVKELLEAPRNLGIKIT